LGLNFNPPDGTTDDLNDGRRMRATNDGPYDERTACYLYIRFRYYLYPNPIRKRKEGTIL